MLVLNLIHKKEHKIKGQTKIRQPDVRNKINLDFVAANYTQTGKGQRHLPRAKRTRTHLTAYGCFLPIQKKLAGWIQIVNVTETAW